MAEETNQRVTNAILKNEIVHLTKKVDKAIERWDGCVVDSAEVKTCMAVLMSQVDDLKRTTQKWDLANSALGLALASLLAYFGLRSQ